jgi:hypothetical protein
MIRWNADREAEDEGKGLYEGKGRDEPVSVYYSRCPGGAQSTDLRVFLYFHYDQDTDEEQVIWFKQTIGHACGSIGLVHCCLNGAARSQITPGSFLEKLLKDVTPLGMGMTPSFLPLIPLPHSFLSSLSPALFMSMNFTQSNGS